MYNINQQAFEKALEKEGEDDEDVSIITLQKKNYLYFIFFFINNVKIYVQLYML